MVKSHTQQRSILKGNASRSHCIGSQWHCRTHNRMVSAHNGIVELTMALHRLTIVLQEAQWQCVESRSHCRARNRMLSRNNGMGGMAIAW
jgi:hypothetical protein